MIDSNFMHRPTLSAAEKNLVNQKVEEFFDSAGLQVIPVEYMSRPLNRETELKLMYNDVISKA